MQLSVISLPRFSIKKIVANEKKNQNHIKIEIEIPNFVHLLTIVHRKMPTNIKRNVFMFHKVMTDKKQTRKEHIY